jgi:hypothetical protein
VVIVNDWEDPDCFSVAVVIGGVWNKNGYDHKSRQELLFKFELGIAKAFGESEVALVLPPIVDPRFPL